MKKMYSLRTKFTLSIALTVLLTVALVSIMANIMINRQFVKYIYQTQQKKTDDIIANLNSQFYTEHNSWNMNMIHMIGMSALHEGYILKVYNKDKQTIWDAEFQNMRMCMQMMSEVQIRMKETYPAMDGEIVLETYPLLWQGIEVGGVEIKYYGPFFISNHDFDFLNSLNLALIGVAAVSQFIVFLVGGYMANRLTKPILKTVDVASQMAEGDYRARIQETTNTLELNQLTVSINHLALTLEKQENLRKQLTADVAHELRTPLTTMGTHIEAMIEGVWELTPERLSSCYEELERISSIVKDLENLAMVESNNLNLDVIELDYWELINKCLDSLEIEIQKKRLIIEKLDGSVTILADPVRWSQVIHNLMINAIKYTPEHGRIKITVSSDEEGATLRISDNGIGIPEADLPFIFERFYRAEKSRNRATGGTGLGLAIVKSIVTAHNGIIQVKSCPGKGTVFIVQLPFHNNY